MQPLSVNEPSFLLAYLFKELSSLKKTRVKQMLKFGSVQVNGEIITSHSHTLKKGDKISFLGKKEATAEREKTRLPFRIEYEDEDVMVVDKPSGLLTVSTESEKEYTLYFAVTAYVRTVQKTSRVFIVHRLDRDTSGLLVLAKNMQAKLFLQSNWDQAVKEYTAVVEGRPRSTEGTIRSSLAEDKFRRVYKTGEKGAKESITHYRVIKSNGSYSLLELSLGTGRKNQIRVHLADEGTPVAGDYKYGAATDPIGRMALHASFLSFPHPTNVEKTLAFKSPEPSDFTALCRL